MKHLLIIQMQSGKTETHEGSFNQILQIIKSSYENQEEEIITNYYITTNI